MSTSRRILAGIAVIALVATLAACDIDLFGNDRRSIVGPYGLFVVEGGKYYLVLDKFQDGCGILGGSVRQIGWSDQVILVDQETCGGRGASSGWVVVNVKTRKIDGPIDQSAIKARSDLSAIQVMTANSAWEKLR